MAEKKANISFKRHEHDTGSPEAQIERLTAEITFLQQHITKNKKDFDAKRALLKKVARRRTFLKYLKKTNVDTYADISKKTGLKV